MLRDMPRRAGQRVSPAYRRTTCADGPKWPVYDVKPKEERHNTSAWPLQDLGIQVRCGDLNSDEDPGRPRFDLCFHAPASLTVFSDAARLGT